jgi:hypothetical protein
VKDQKQAEETGVFAEAAIAIIDRGQRSARSQLMFNSFSCQEWILLCANAGAGIPSNEELKEGLVFFEESWGKKPELENK